MFSFDLRGAYYHISDQEKNRAILWFAWQDGKLTKYYIFNVYAYIIASVWAFFLNFFEVSPYSVHIIFGSVWVAEWPPFANTLLTQMITCFLNFLIICNVSSFPLWL